MIDNDVEDSLKENVPTIKDSPDGEWDEFPFDEESWPLIAPMTAGPFLVGYVDDICGEDGKLTSANITRAETKVLAEYYLRERIVMSSELVEQGQCVGSSDLRMQLYANKRINDFIEVGAISEKCVNELDERIIGETK